MRTLGVVTGFLLLGVFAMFMAPQFMGFATSGSLSGTAQDFFDVTPTLIYTVAAVAFGCFVIAAFYQFVFKHGR